MLTVEQKAEVLSVRLTRPTLWGGSFRAAGDIIEGPSISMRELIANQRATLEAAAAADVEAGSPITESASVKSKGKKNAE